MTVVLVHGNPETAAVWGPLVAELGRNDVVRLSPPGFGSPAPAGFGATSDDYLEWLAGEVAGVESPVDIVGHDWGGGHVLRLACRRPDLIRSWVSDIAGCFHPDYRWHDAAQVWQTPGAGEEAVEAVASMPVEQRSTMFQAFGMTPEAAGDVATAYGADMARCTLSLYRSAGGGAMARWGEELPQAAARPGLVLIPTEDPFTGGPEKARWAAQRAGALVAELEGLGHWWMLQDPAAGADALRRFWAGL